MTTIQTNGISVIVTTRNRPEAFSECLRSIRNQSSRPDELCIVINAIYSSSLALGNQHKYSVSYPTKIIIEKRAGYPFAYNAGLNHAHHKWIAFIDDDCVADVAWIATIRKTIRSYPKAAALLGETLPIYKHNCYSIATNIFHSEWKEKNTRGTKIHNLEILDTKNIVYNAEFLSTHKLRYDEQRTSYLHGAAQDCDLGRKIQQHGGKAYYIRSIRALHHEPTTVRTYISKYITSLAAYESYREKWEGIVTTHPRVINLRQFSRRYIQKHAIQQYNKVLLASILVCTAIANLLFPLFLHNQTRKRAFFSFAETLYNKTHEKL